MSDSEGSVSDLPIAPMGDGLTQVSSMPLPPMQFIAKYTDEAIIEGIAPLPPPPITDAPYKMFGQPFSSEDSIVSSLESQGIRRLYSAKEVDRKRELRKLNHSALVNFLDLLDIQIKCPDSVKRAEKIEDLNLLFIHMHHLINEFRPHQARETLRVMLHVQKRKRNQLAQKFGEHLDKVQDTLQAALDELPDSNEEEQDTKTGLKNDLNNGHSNSESFSQGGCCESDLALCRLIDNDDSLLGVD